jgi:hypothetical protein
MWVFVLMLQVRVASADGISGVIPGSNSYELINLTTLIIPCSKLGSYELS